MKRAAVMVLLFGLLAVLHGQTSSNSSKSSGSSGGSSMDFAIETEMLTYRAVESNSEAVACDIAGYLGNVPVKFGNAATGPVCDVKLAGRLPTVIVVPFDNDLFTGFQIWRSEMATMDRLQRKAAACSATKGGTTGPALTVRNILDASPAGGPLAVAQSVLAVMTKDETLSPVMGTVHDDAFVDGVARQLRSFGILVLTPATYAPFALTPLDRGTSPFLASLERTLDAQEKCYELIATETSAEKPGEPKSEASRKANDVIASINAFLTALTQAPPPPSTASGTGAATSGSSTAAGTSSGAAGSSGTAPASGGKQSGGQNASLNTAPPASGSLLSTVLSADGLAQKLGVEPTTGALPPNMPQHVLLVKALESGGAVMKHTNFFGGSVSYSGGAVGTYALFTTSGDLECSGNVYDYLGALNESDFQKQLRTYNLDPKNQLVFLRGGCRVGAR